MENKTDEINFVIYRVITFLYISTSNLQNTKKK